MDFSSFDSSYFLKLYAGFEMTLEYNARSRGDNRRLLLLTYDLDDSSWAVAYK